MKLLLGCTRKKEYLRIMRELGWGRLWSSELPKPYPGEPWALDNGVFAAWQAKRPWNEPSFNMVLQRTTRRIGYGIVSRPLFITIPDRVADPTSLDYSIGWYRENARFYEECCGDGRPLPWYLVLQNGMQPRKVARVLSQKRNRYIEGCFLGGNDEFKLTAPTWKSMTDDLGLGFHFARVSTIARLAQACNLGVASADTTQFLWTDEMFAKLVHVWEAFAPFCGD